MTDFQALRASPLAPSEVVLLNGEAFAPPPGLADKLALLHTEGAVSAAALARALLAAAFLAAEQAGALRLEVRPKPTPFGPSKVLTLYAEPGGADPAWPEHSLEARLRGLAGEIPEAAAVTRGLLEADSPNPWHQAAELVKRGLARRGLLDVVEVVQFGFVKTPAYELPAATRALAAQAPVAAVQQLLKDCEQGRPAVWAQLRQQLDAGLQQRLRSAGAPVPRRAADDDE